MTHENYSEDDTRAKLIDPALHNAGWREPMIRRAVPIGKGAVEMGRDGIPHRANPKQADYILSVARNDQSEFVPLAILEAKKENLPPDAGMQQVREYARLFNVPVVFSANGHQFAEMNRLVGIISKPRKMSEFPGPDELRRRFKDTLDFALDEPVAEPLHMKYTPSGKPRYYQDAAIRAAMEKIARCEKQGKPRRVLLPLATGAGKTHVAVNLMRRIADAKHSVCALFLCDRVELRDQARDAFEKEFGNDAVIVENRRGENPAKNARIHIATYQTLGVGRDADGENQSAVDAGATFNRLYPQKNFFSHIIVDECHRSAWNDWSLPLRRNPSAVHIGLTATPRAVNLPAKFRNAEENQADEQITADNRAYFGEPVYEYSIAQGMDDGYLALCMLDICRPNLDMAGGISGEEVAKHKPTDLLTGELVDKSEINPHYAPETFETQIHLPDRVREMCADLFNKLRNDSPQNTPDQKTIVFCESNHHADAVVAEMQNLRAELAAQNGETPPENYAFKCTAEANGAKLVKFFKTRTRDQFIAVTIDLLSTGVDVPPVRNLAFFRHLKSPIAFHQMLGRGTRIHEESGKLVFNVYDYTGVSALMGEELASRVRLKTKRDKDRENQPDDDREAVRKIRVDGLEVWINKLGQFVVKDGKVVSRAEYERQIAERLREKFRDLGEFSEQWTNPDRRAEMMNFLAQKGLSPNAALIADGRDGVDLYDYLAQVAWDANPKTRKQRADDFRANHKEWLNAMTPSAADTVRAIIAVFADGGTEELESPDIFKAPRVAKTGGLESLKSAGNPGETITEMKRRLFAD